MQKLKIKIFIGQKGPRTCALVLCILKSLSRTCLDALTANVTACVQLKSQSSRRQRHMRKLTASATPKTDIQITAGADHCDVTMPRAQRGMLVENLKKKKKKHKPLQMSKGHRVLSNLYSAPSAHSRTCRNIKHSSFCKSAFRAP